MFVVRRAFRTKGGPVSAGSVVEPADIQNFKYRIGEKHIVEVTEHNYTRYASFFKERFGVDIPDPATVLTKDQLVAAKEAAIKAAPVKSVAKAVSTK